ncbi:MAG: hypothetical protein J3K34DRAFT_418192 [Monoraphidium minutum]|nr:MAG: hypothetical protein J3K34DRAFT_418192 [Monoraphidium minutum]
MLLCMWSMRTGCCMTSSGLLCCQASAASTRFLLGMQCSDGGCGGLRQYKTRSRRRQFKTQLESGPGGRLGEAKHGHTLGQMHQQTRHRESR